MLKRILIFLLALCCCVPALADTYQGYNYEPGERAFPRRKTICRRIPLR